jgi:hypothetical protein
MSSPDLVATSKKSPAIDGWLVCAVPPKANATVIRKGIKAINTKVSQVRGLGSCFSISVRIRLAVSGRNALLDK